MSNVIAQAKVRAYRERVAELEAEVESLRQRLQRRDEFIGALGELLASVVETDAEAAQRSEAD